MRSLLLSVDAVSVHSPSGLVMRRRPRHVGRLGPAGKKTIHIAGLFLNDYIHADGSVKAKALEQIDDPKSALREFLVTFATLEHKALIVGGNSMVWNVEADYNDVVTKVVEAAREFGIPTVTGTKCWLRMPLATYFGEGMPESTKDLACGEIQEFGNSSSQLPEECGASCLVLLLSR